MIKKIALMTGGGDCAGINAFIAAAVRRGIVEYNAEFVGIRKAYEGASADDITSHIVPLTLEAITGIENKPSTILESSRFFPFSPENTTNKVPEKLLANLKKIGADAVLSTGGNDTIKSGMKLAALNFPVICAPKSIDNDVSGTDIMLGYKTAVDFGATAVRSTVESARTHRRISVVEIMGREAGWLTLEIGIAAGADLIVIPEYPLDLATFCHRVGQIYQNQNYVNIVVAEGSCFRQDDPVLGRARLENPVLDALIDEDLGMDAHGNPKLGGIGQILRRIIKVQLGLKKIEDIRGTDLGFSLRGQVPVAEDIVLGTRLGFAAVDLLLAGTYGMMVGIQGTQIVKVSFAEALQQKKVNWPEQELRSVGVVM